jgi:hypothetical protein
VLLVFLAPLAAEAKSWCASPLVAHEWGVHLVRADGQAAAGTPLPSWFHHDTGSGPARGVPVWDLPPDSGIRDLPVVQFYAPSRPVPLGLEVGFADDSASSWWPQVDRFVPAVLAGSPTAMRGRETLLEARARRTPHGTNPPLGPDPTKQLGWDALTLSDRPATPPNPAEQPWVDALRNVPNALWVDAPGESDRFLFYEASTRDAPDLVLTRGDTWTPTRAHHVLHNRSDWTVHDVVVLANGRAWTAPAIPAGASAGFLLDQPLDRAGVVAWLRQRWTDPAGPPLQHRWDVDDCVMMRDPAIPVDRATGYRLYGPEVDVLLDVWAERLLADGPGVRIVYREDPAALDARMPLAVYTDMMHFVQLSRLGVVAVEGVTP